MKSKQKRLPTPTIKESGGLLPHFSMRTEEILEAARQRKESVQVETEYQEILRVLLDDEWYGINIADVAEVIKCPEIFGIPHTPDYIVGVVNLRGEVLAVMDIKKLLGLPAALSEDQKHIVVVERDNVKIGLKVDKAAGLISVPNSDIKPLLSTGDKAKGFIAGEIQLNEEVLAILNLDALTEEEQ